MEEQQVQKQQYVSVSKKIEQHNKKARKIQSQIQTVNLNLMTTFGMCAEPVSNQLYIVGNNIVIYYVGVTLIVRDMQLKTYTHLVKEGGLQNVTALAAVQTPKGLIVAVGESTDHRDYPVQISLWIKNRWHTLTDGQLKGTIKLIQINENSNYVVSKIENGMQTHIDFWNYKNEKLLAQASTRLQFGKFTINPRVPKNIILSGHQYLRTWELLFQAKQLKESSQQLIPLKIEKETKFLDHCWIHTSVPLLVVLIPNNKVFLIQNEQLKKIITLEFLTSNIWPVEVKELIAESVDEYQGLNNMLENIVVSKPKFDQNNESEKARSNLKQVQFITLTNTRKGFIIGGDLGYISIFEIDNQMVVTNSLNFQVKIPGQSKTVINQLHCSQNDSLISIISSQDSQVNYSLLNTFQLDSDKQPIEPFFPSGFHKKKVTCLSVSNVKSVYASCSSDKTVKFWNYQDEMRGLFSIEFDNEPNYISLHPSGLFIAISFQMNLKIFAILNQSLVLLKELVLGSCTICKYSNKGHYLATNENQVIHVFESINYNLLVSLEKHVSLIKTIEISEDDFIMVTQCMNGFINIWDVQKEIEKFKAKQNFQYRINMNQNQQQMQTIQHQLHNCFCYFQYFKEKDLFIAAGNEKYLSIYQNGMEDLIVEFPMTDGVIIHSLHISRLLKLLFCGTSIGTIRVYPWPLIEEALELIPIDQKQCRLGSPEFFEIQVHSSPVVSLKTSHDEQYLIIGVGDGTISMLKIYQKYEEGENSQMLRLEDRMKMTSIINDMMFIHQSRVIEMNENIKKLNFEVVKSEQTVMIETQKIQMLFQQKLQKIQQNIDQLTKEFQDQETEMEQVFSNQYQQLSDIHASDQKNYEEQMQALTVENQRQVQYETQRNSELEQEIQQMNGQYQEYFQSQLEQHKKDLKNLRLSYQRKCEQIQLKYSNVVNNAKNFGTAFINRLDKQEQEYNRELEDQVTQLKEEIQQIIMINYDLNKQNNKLQEENDELKQKDDNLQVKFNQQMDLHTEIVAQNLKNDEAMVKQQHQLLERIQVIESKDETCREARDEQINLENFRYLLDQKIKMLQNEKTQILEKLKEKEQNLKQMFQELIKETDKNDKKYIEFKNINREKDIQMGSLQKVKDQNSSMKTILSQFQSTILQIMKTPDQIAPTSRKLYELIDYVPSSTPQPSMRSNYSLEGDDINQELEKQGRWMNRKLWLIDETNKKLKEIREENVDQILNQNTKLIEECNILRAENERYKKLTRNVQKMLLEAKRMKNKKLQKKPNIKKLVKKYEENTMQLKSQTTQLNNLQQSINDLLKSDSEDQIDSTKFPSINKQKLQSQSMTMNQSKEPQKQLPILIEESL